MTAELNTLVIAAASIGFFHTLLGPDHYLPFVMMSWARKWSVTKTALITFLCGLGHVASSVVLGLVGVMFGLAVNKLEVFESSRGNVAAWLLIAFGLAYTVWGLRKAYRGKAHTHGHKHIGEAKHDHEHEHHQEHTHIHDEKKAVTPWVLFVIFVFGPCEPLIPILMYPAAKASLFGMVIVTGVFGIVTIGTMLGVVLLARRGISFAWFEKLHRFAHVIAGATICFCGLAIAFLGV